MTILIVSRYIPLEHHAGHFTYLLDLMRYLHQCEFELELDVLDPWFLPEYIPPYIYKIAQVFIMPSSFLQERQKITEKRSVKKILYPLYSRLPLQLLRPLRQRYYHVQGKSVPGLHNVDALATEAEIAFVTHRVKYRQPDLLLANETFLGNILQICQDDREVLKACIAFDLHHQRSVKFQQNYISSKNHSEWSYQKEQEQLTWANVVLSIHEEDARILRQMVPQNEVMYAPMSATFHPHEPAEQIPGRCLFVGSDIDHNVHGMTWFLRETWPLILQQQPQATLHVCGTVCSKIDNAFPNVQLLGRIEHLDTEYAATEVCLIPLVVGSGLKIKLVEALSHGRACVATSVGVQGVQELREKAVLVADTPQDFAQAVISVLTNAEQRCFMEEEARRYVIEALAPEKTYQLFVERIYRHLSQTKILRK